MNRIWLSDPTKSSKGIHYLFWAFSLGFFIVSCHQVFSSGFPHYRARFSPLVFFIGSQSFLQWFSSLSCQVFSCGFPHCLTKFSLVVFLIILTGFLIVSKSFLWWFSSLSFGFLVSPSFLQWFCLARFSPVVYFIVLQSFLWWFSSLSCQVFSSGFLHCLTEQQRPIPRPSGASHLQ